MALEKEQDTPLTDADQAPAGTNEGFADAFAEFAKPDSGTDQATQDTDTPRDSAASAGAGNTDGTDKEAQPAAAAGATTSPQADPWANAAPELRAAHEAAQRQISALTHAAKSNNGRITSLNRRIEELTATKPAASAAGTDKPNAPTGALGGAKFKALKDEYPEIAEPLEEMLSEIARENEALRAQIAPIAGDRRQAVIDRNEGALAEKHPDWQQAAASPDFANWINEQPDDIKQIAVKNGEHITDPVAAAKLMTLFKAETGFKTHAVAAPAAGGKPTNALPDKRQRQLAAAAAPGTRAPSAGSGPPDDFDAAFKHFATR